ncbi:pentatricopeptide repeat-containing protein [Iris pallida]|uniref:Pentatricopeptide repeat-containing protein n=1 Tax=Iris pallida TaxID=29817 RepID=A0AAX6DMZ9_IRIPA|nr:pentatricopeptide repeat-containing protein [Iris pallida]
MAILSSSSHTKNLTLTPKLLLPFSTDSVPSPDPEPSPTAARPLRRSADEELSSTIALMVSRRPWTTRLQSTIRTLVPEFRSPLVLSLLDKTSDRDPQKALDLFRWIEKTGFRHDQETYQLMSSLLSHRRMLNHARCLLLDDMPKRSLLPTEQSLAELIIGYGRERIPQEAVKLFSKMPELGVDRTVVSYDAFFKAILLNGRFQMAKRTFNSMARQGVHPALSTYVTLIWGFSLCGKMETAKRFFDDMKERKIEPDVVAYNTLLNGFVRAKNVEAAEKLVEEMRKIGMEPNIITYNLMIKGYMASAKVDEGLRMFEEMRGKEELEPTERTYAALIPWLCDDPTRTGDAKKVFDEMAERRITPKDKNKSVFVRLITSMFQRGDTNGAVEVHRAMDKFSVPVGSAHYGVLMEGLCKAGKFDAAVEILDEFLEKGVLSGIDVPPLEASAYNPMIEYLCGNGIATKAETLFRQLMRRGVDDKVAFNNLIRGHAREGRPESAFEMLTIMTRRGVVSDADAYVLLVESFLKKGEPADARTVLDGMIEQGHLPSPALFRSVMVGLFDNGRVQTAGRVMKSMLDKGVKENMDIVQKILEALLMRGHVEEALGRINLMLTNSLAPDFDSLIVNLCDSDKPIPALKLVDFGLERDCDFAFSSYDRLLEALYAAGRTLPAYSILCKIKAKGGVVDKKGCEAVIKSLNDQGNTKQADILSRILAGKAPVMMKKGKKVMEDAF